MADELTNERLSMEQVSEFLDGSSLDIIRDIAPHDPMYAYAPDYYFKAGQSALRNIRLAMLAGQVQKVDRILDFACGSGRVLRILKAAFPDADLTACDVQPEAVEFCEQTFGVTGVTSAHDPDDVELDGSYDLIWCGSLLTHVDADRWVRFVKLFESALAPGGVAVFTTYGRFIAERRLRKRDHPLDLNEEQIEGVLHDYDDEGFGFRAGFCPELNFGDCVATREWVSAQLEKTPALQLLLYIEGGWGVYRNEWSQDVIACAKAWD
jgi:SAM-dependent methyltransferase